MLGSQYEAFLEDQPQPQSPAHDVATQILKNPTVAESFNKLLTNPAVIQGLLGAGASMMANSRSGQPTGAIIGQGLLGGMTVYQAAEERRRQEKRQEMLDKMTGRKMQMEEDQHKWRREDATENRDFRREQMALTREMKEEDRALRARQLGLTETENQSQAELRRAQIDSLGRGKAGDFELWIKEDPETGQRAFQRVSKLDDEAMMNAETAGFIPSSVWRTEASARRAADKPDYTPGKAMKRASDIQRMRSSLGKTDMVTTALAALNPEFQGLVGQKLDPDTKSQIDQSWNDELDYLSQFIPEKYRGRFARPSSGGSTGAPGPASAPAAGVTHKFVPGQGLVPVQ